MVSRIATSVAIVAFILAFLALRNAVGIGAIGTLGLLLVIGTVVGAVGMRLQMRKQDRR
jgi:hypothetical protein